MNDKVWDINPILKAFEDSKSTPLEIVMTWAKKSLPGEYLVSHEHFEALQSLVDIIDAQDQELRDARAVIEFYGSEDNYDEVAKAVNAGDKAREWLAKYRGEK